MCCCLHMERVHVHVFTCRHTHTHTHTSNTFCVHSIYTLHPPPSAPHAPPPPCQVANTDAEGRLTIADALWYAEHKLGATAIVNIATLTGAMIVSLGTGIAGVLTPNDAVADRYEESGGG